MFDGLAIPVVLAVAVCAARLPMLTRLVTLAGLFSDLSSNCIGLGMEAALSAASPIGAVATAGGASCGLLKPLLTPELSVETALCAGFSLVAFPSALACS